MNFYISGLFIQKAFLLLVIISAFLILINFHTGLWTIEYSAFPNAHTNKSVTAHPINTSLVGQEMLLPTTTREISKSSTDAVTPPRGPHGRATDRNNRTFILNWRRPWGALHEGWREGATFGKCVVTHRKDKIKDAAAVIFHYSALDEETMPWRHYRDAGQVFVFFSMESPAFMYNLEKRKNFKKFHNFINWTMSYRHDSDVLFSYVEGSSIREFLSHWKRNFNEMMSMKSRVALWVVSNCDSNFGSQLRMKFVKGLVAAGLPVARFGKCFNNRIQFARLDADILYSFKFYLAFENARYCKDYVTEKFWTNAILKWRVPVVFGAAKDDVAAATPLNSFVHVDDFHSPEELTKYLMYLDRNATAYREYFAWIERPDPHTIAVLQRYMNNRMSLLCDMVTSRGSILPKNAGNITEFMYGGENEECLRN